MSLSCKNSLMHHVCCCFADFNECEYGNAGCEQICTNSIPGYKCECYAGYRLDENGVNCISEYVMLILVQYQQKIYYAMQISMNVRNLMCATLMLHVRIMMEVIIVSVGTVSLVMVFTAMVSNAVVRV